MPFINLANEIQKRHARQNKALPSKSISVGQGANFFDIFNAIVISVLFLVICVVHEAMVANNQNLSLNCS